MRPLTVLIVLALGGLAGPGLSQTVVSRPEAAVITLSLDEARQGQIKHGRSLIASLGHEQFGRFQLLEPTVSMDDFRFCEEKTPEFGLAGCARFYLHQSLTPESPPHVVVVFADHRPGAPSDREGGDMRALCFGRGAESADPAAQDIWLWTDSGRVHGVNDWRRDQDALAACINAALLESPGEPKPQ